MRSLGRPSPAIVIAFIALFVAASGGAWAAGGVPGTDGHVAQKDKAKKKKAKPKRGKRGKAGPRGSRGATGAAGAAGARGAQGPQGAQGPTGPSAGFSLRQSDNSASVPTGAEATAVTDTLTLPSGNYIVNASLELGGNSGAVRITNCELRRGNTIIAQGSARTTGSQFETTLALTGSSTGGSVRIFCNPDVSSIIARNRAITAVRVGSLN